MKQEERNLLIQDLCARLSYEVKVKTDNLFPQKLKGIIFDEDTFLYSVSDGEFTLDWMSCKPYLYPLSSMTEEQKEEYESIIFNQLGLPCDENDVIVEAVDRVFEFYHKHHLDYRGLIEKGLAIDCTNLNIY